MGDKAFEYREELFAVFLRQTCNILQSEAVEKTSAYLGKYLSEQNLFADKRTLPEFAAWNAALAEYRAFVQSDVDS